MTTSVRQCPTCKDWYDAQTGLGCKCIRGHNSPDNINNPIHYTQGAIQPIDFITANNMDFCTGNAVKYLTR